MTIAEAAKVLGVSTKAIKRYQQKGWMPDPIPDNYLDHVIKFRIDLENALRRKVDRAREQGT